MTLFLIRHAQSANNALYDSSGSTIGRVEDPELTSLGVRQAQILADSDIGMYLYAKSLEIIDVIQHGL